MKRLLAVLLMVTILAMGAFGCARSVEKSSYDVTTPGIAPVPEEAGGFGFSVGSSAQDSSANYDADDGELVSGEIERMIVRNGDISLVVDDVQQTRDDIAVLAESSGGYTVSSRVWEYRDSLRGNITIRVPDEDFDSVFAELRDMAVKVTSESSDAQDVTEEYVDLQARLGNAEATEAQYTALLDQAKSVEDTLEIYAALKQIRQEIEQLKGRIQYLEMTSSMSLISVELTSTTSLVAESWNIGEIWRSAVRGLTGFGQWLASALIWVLIFTPVWGAITALVVWLVRRKRKKTVQQ